jgi:hypothetical protein
MKKRSEDRWKNSNDEGRKEREMEKDSIRGKEGRKKRWERRKDRWKDGDYAKVGEEKIDTRRELMRKGGEKERWEERAYEKDKSIKTSGLTPSQV